MSVIIVLAQATVSFKRCQEPAAQPRARSYGDVADAVKAKLDCAVGLRIKETGKYLIHSEHKGNGHCIAVHNDGSGVLVFNGNRCWRLTALQLEDSSSALS